MPSEVQLHWQGFSRTMSNGRKPFTVQFCEYRDRSAYGRSWVAFLVRRIRNKGNVVINNEYLSHRCDNVPTIVYMIAYSADHLSSVMTCQHHMRLRPYKNQFN